MKKVLMGILVGAIAISLTGCTAFLLGSGAVAGVGMSIDTIRLERIVDKQTAWDVTKSTLAELGEITLENQAHHELEAEIDEAKVKVEILQAKGKKQVWIDVKVRKKGIPDLTLANDLVDKINDNLKIEIRNKNSSQPAVK